MPVRQTTVKLSDFGDGSFERRTRTTGSGSSDRYSATIEAKPVVLEFDPKALGAKVATAITEHLRQRISGISADAAPSTQLKRKYASAALMRGEHWAVKRYAGGKTGPTPPNQTSRLFNDSGRFVRGLIARPTRDNNWVINVAANRLRLENEGATMRMVDRLRQFVPEFGSGAALLGVTAIQVAIRETSQAIIAGSAKGKELGKFLQEVSKVALDALAKQED